MKCPIRDNGMQYALERADIDKGKSGPALLCTQNVFVDHSFEIRSFFLFPEVP